jgi:hypothetical protein
VEIRTQQQWENGNALPMMWLLYLLHPLKEEKVWKRRKKILRGRRFKNGRRL